MTDQEQGKGLRGSVWKAMLDDETQVLRERVFDYLFDLEVKKATRYQYFLALLFLELDLPRGEGATAENEAARLGQIGVLAELLRDELRSTDIIGKFSEGRFTVLLHHADEINTQRIGERLRRRIADYVFTSGQSGHRTVSIGGACFPASGNYPEELRSGASRMIERAKQGGGNKVCLVR
jgi:diguanylate cyclase (GGDEF)-like protein